MKKLSFILSLLVLGISVDAQLTINDPNAEVREAKNFHAISVSNAFDVFISQGNDEAVAVSATDQKYRDEIKVEVDNGVLKIGLKNEGKFWKGWNGDKTKLKAYISIKKIDRLDVSGACDVFFEEGISSEDLTVRLSGASDLKGKIDAKKLSFDISGASDATISGNAAELSVEASGASDFKGFDMTTNYCTAEASGASSVNITVNKELNAKASGASSVRFKGEGLIRDIKTSGASNVTRKS